MKRGHSLKRHFSMLGLFLILLLNGSCSRQETTFSRHQTLFVGGFQWASPTNFNPLSSSPDWPNTGNINLIYEPLFAYNMLSGSLDPLLGKSYKFRDDSTLIIQIQQSATWHDGTPVLLRDILYTYELHRQFPTPFHGDLEYIDTLFESAPWEVTIRLNRLNLNPMAVKDVISTIPILPKKVFNGLELWATRYVKEAGEDSEVRRAKIFSLMQEKVMMSELMGSGPYQLRQSSQQKIVLERYDAYWGNDQLHEGMKPTPKYIIHPLFSSNDKYNLALQQGRLDFSRTFFPLVGSKKSKGIGTWLDKEPYYVPGSIPVLVPNVATANDAYAPPAVLKDRSFRQAITAAIDYENIRRVAIDGYALPLQSGYILPSGAEQEYFSQASSDREGIKYNPAMAKAILSSAGYSWPSKGGVMLDPQGVPVPTLFVTAPAGWTDWEIALGIVVESLTKIGIPAKIKVVDESRYFTILERGLFDLILHTYQPDESASLPWSRFERTLSGGAIQPLGVESQSNMGRYKNREIDSLLTVIPQLHESPRKLKKAYLELNKVFMAEMPAIPLMYRPGQYYQFSTKHWDNFPTSLNWYAPPQDLMRGAGVQALWGITAKSKGK